MKKPEITIVGCGPGSPDYLTFAGKQAIDGAEVLVGARRLLDLFPDQPGERIPVSTDIEGVLDTIDVLSSQKKVVVLVTGDPGLCSLAKPVLKRFGLYRCQVIPGISSVQVAFARIGLDWLDARIIDAHSQVPEIDPSSLANENKIVILAGHNSCLDWIGQLVQTHSRSFRIYLCENLTLDDECIRQVETAELGMLNVSSRSIILLISV